MRWLFGLFLSLVFSSVSAQKISEGLWNSGRVFSVIPAEHADSLVLQKLVGRVQLYAGFSVVRTDLDLVNPGKDSIVSVLDWKSSTSTTHSFFGNIGNLSSVERILIVNNDTVPVNKTLVFAPGLTTVTVFEITPNQQAVLSRSGSVKEANAFVYSISPAPWKKTLVQQVFVQLAGDLTLTNVMGIYPDSNVTATMSQVKWIPLPEKSATEQSLVIWYEGAAPDMKMEKRVLPVKNHLYKELNNLNLALFDTPSFVVADKKDFSANKRSPLFSILYFLMFASPWVILVAFLFWLVSKPKKKKES